MTDLLKNDTEFKWTKECEEAFKELKSQLASFPILKFADVTKPFQLHCTAIGAQLC